MPELSTVYFLTVNYENIIPKYTWLEAFSSPYENNECFLGHPVTVHIPPNENEIYLILGRREESSRNPTLLKSFKLKVDNSQEIRKIIIQARYMRFDNEFEIHVNNNSSPYSLIQDEFIFCPEDWPAKLESTFTTPLNIFWIIDGTQTAKGFSKCIDSSIFLIDEFKSKFPIKCGYLVFGDYEEIWQKGIFSPPQGAFTISPHEVKFHSAKEFIRHIDNCKMFPLLPKDDPAAALEYALKKLADVIEDLDDDPICVIIAGNSLPHFTVEEIFSKKVSVIPTEEFENIHWEKQINRLKEKPNVFILPIWVEDDLSNSKWDFVNSFGNDANNNIAREWWNAELPDSIPCINVHNSTSATGMMLDIYKAIESIIPSEYILSKKLGLPLRHPLDLKTEIMK